MKALFEAWARYTVNANRQMCACITASPALLSMETDTFFKTIGGTLYHLIDTNLRWLTRMGSFRTAGTGHGDLEPYQTGGEADIHKIVREMDGFLSLLAAVDGDIDALIRAVPAEAFSADYTMQFGPKKITRPLWELLFQWLNHHTHHRGQVSLLLDLGGVDNDYSLVLDKI